MWYHIAAGEIMYDRSKLKINAYKSKELVVVRRNERVVRVDGKEREEVGIFKYVGSYP